MAQHFKYNTGSTITNTSQKGNLSIATSGTQDWGPTSTTGFYPDTSAPNNGYTIYFMRPTGGPSVHVAPTNAAAIFLLKSFGSTGSTINDVLSWASGQANYYVATGATPTPTPTATATPTPTATATPTPTPTPTATSAAQYYYGATAELAHAMTNGLSGVSFASGSDLCGATGTMYANEFANLPANQIYIYDSVNTTIRPVTPLGYYIGANFSGSCTYQYGRYRVATTQNGVCTSYTGFTDPNFYSSTMCSQSYFGSNQLTGLTAGTYYMYDTVTQNERMFGTSYTGNTLFYYSGSCTTNTCLQYVYSTTEVGTCTSTSGLTNVNFSGGTLCSGSTITANEFSGMTSGVYYVRDTFTDNVRMTYVYGGGMTSAYLSGTTCSTPCTVSRSGYYYATSMPEAITGGTQVNSVTFSGGSGLCGGTSAFDMSFGSLSGYIYIYNASTGDVRQFYGMNSTTITAMNPCLNTNTPVYYYSTMSNDCYGNMVMSGVTFSGGSDICSASGFSANNLSSLSPNTYYLRNPFTNKFRSFYCAYNGFVNFSGSCTDYAC